MEQSKPYFKIENLTVGYDAIPVIKGVTLSACQGNIIGIVGGNGSGKSTLLQTVAGLMPAIEGDILIEGKSIIGCSTLERVREFKLGYLPQYNRRISNLTVAENLRLAQWKCRSRSQRERNIERLLAESPFNQLRGHLHENAGVLSGGQTLLLALATLSIQDSKLMLLDEPSDGLDARNRSMIVEMIQQMRSSGRVILVVEQLLRVVFSISDKVYVAGQPGSQLDQPSRINSGRLRELGIDDTRYIRDIYAQHSTLLPAHFEAIDSLLWRE